MYTNQNDDPTSYRPADSFVQNCKKSKTIIAFKPSVTYFALMPSRQMKIPFGKAAKDYGGKFRNTRRDRSRPRPIAVKCTMHLILKSTMAIGEFSFGRPKNSAAIEQIVAKFAFIYGVKIISYANAWNHLHFQIRLSNRFSYTPFIRAVTGAIALAVAGRRTRERGRSAKFWDYRPFTRIADSYKAYLHLRDYVRMNEIESIGYSRDSARSMVQIEKNLWGSS